MNAGYKKRKTIKSSLLGARWDSNPRHSEPQGSNLEPFYTYQAYFFTTLNFEDLRGHFAANFNAINRCISRFYIFGHRQKRNNVETINKPIFNEF